MAYASTAMTGSATILGSVLYGQIWPVLIAIVVVLFAALLIRVCFRADKSPADI